MKIAFVIYVLLSYSIQDNPNRQTIEIISWGLPFNNINECVGFWNKYKPDLLNGALVHSNSKYGYGSEIEESGCVKVEVSVDVNGSYAKNKSDREILYTKEKNE
tara:strand:- start:28 stop:339 length:312 start_codon:yes stop_codon:yes gene_type:complete